MRISIIVIALVVASHAASARAQTAADYETGCDGAADAKWCEIQLAKFRKWFPRALRGDYQGQRNVAFCLSDGCDGAVQQRPITGCAWRIVIVSSGSPKIDQSDTLNLKTFCGKLDEVERVAAKAQAFELIKKIEQKR